MLFWFIAVLNMIFVYFSLCFVFLCASWFHHLVAADQMDPGCKVVSVRNMNIFIALRHGCKKVAGHVVVSLLLFPPQTPFSPSCSVLLFGFQTSDWRRRHGPDVTAPVAIHQRTWALYSASHLRRGPISARKKRGKKYI